MNKSNIEWTEFTSNPIRGKCHHACPYCYAERIRQRFKQPETLSWHPDELAQISKRKKPSTIFMGSMYDIFGEWVPESYIHWIIDTAKNCPQHTFLFLTKNPSRYQYFEFTDNCWCGWTVTKEDDLPVGFGITKTGGHTFTSFEPLLSGISDIPDAEQYIIGVMTGPKSVKPEKAWIENIIEKAGSRPVFLKNNLIELFPNFPKMREIAWKL